MKSTSLKLITLLMATVMLATVALILPAEAADLPSLYVSQINKSVIADAGAVFTKSFNGTNKVLVDNQNGGANLLWAYVIVAKPTSKTGVFEVTVKQQFYTDKTTLVEIPEGGFIYAAHCDNSEEAQKKDTFAKIDANFKRVDGIKVGDKLTISGIDIAAGTAQANAVIYLGDNSANVPSESSTPSTSTPSESSTPSTSSTPSVSSTASNNPETGDSGIAYFAIAAIISLAGATVFSLKKRSR